jgi:uncharacterized membrane protein
MTSRGRGALAQQRWVALKEWSGEPGSLDTERFTTRTSLFRVRWETRDLGRGGILDLYVRDDDGRLVRAAVSLQSDDTTREQGSGAGAFEVSTDPGDYYLEIRSTGVRWTVAVEQPAPGEA